MRHGTGVVRHGTGVVRHGRGMVRHGTGVVRHGQATDLSAEAGLELGHLSIDGVNPRLERLLDLKLCRRVGRVRVKG